MSEEVRAANRAAKAAVGDVLVFGAVSPELALRAREAVTRSGGLVCGGACAPETMLAAPTFAAPVALSRKLFESLGRFRPQARGALLYDLVLRASERAPVTFLPGAPSAGSSQALLDFSAHRSVVASALRRRDVGARIVRGDSPGTVRVRPTIPPHTRVAIILSPSEHTERWRCIIAERTAFRRCELIIEVDRDRAARSARAHQLLFLDPLAEPRDRQWLQALLEWSTQAEIGAVCGAAFGHPVHNTVAFSGTFMIGREKLRRAGGIAAGELGPRLVGIELRNLATPYAFKTALSLT